MGRRRDRQRRLREREETGHRGDAKVEAAETTPSLPGLEAEVQA